MSLLSEVSKSGVHIAAKLLFGSNFLFLFFSRRDGHTEIKWVEGILVTFKLNDGN